MSLAAFFDHHTSVDARWVTVISGTGAVSSTSSKLRHATAATGTDVAGTYCSTRPVYTDNFMWWTCCGIDAGGSATFGAVWADSTVPAAAGAASLIVGAGAKMVIRVSSINTSTGIAFQYLDTGGARLSWTTSWVTTNAAITGITYAPADNALWCLENDGVGNGSGPRWRLHLFAGDSPMVEGTLGLRSRVVTNWVLWSATLGGGANLWAVYGDWFTSSSVNGNMDVEWTRWLTGTKVPILYNGKGTAAGTYRIYSGHSYGSHADGLIFVRTDNTTVAIDVGAAAAWDDYQTQFKSMCLGSDGTYYAAYTGRQNVPSDLYIGMASASDPEGTWTKYASNPVFGTAGELRAAPFLFETPSATNKWNLLYTRVSGGVWSLELVTTTNSTPLTTTWATAITVLAVGATGVWDASNISNPVAFFDNNQWNLLYAGASPSSPTGSNWGIGLATGPAGQTDVATAFASMTKYGSNPLVAKEQGADALLNGTATATRTPAIDTLSGTPGTFDADALIVIDDDTNKDQYVMVRLRTAISGAGATDLYNAITHTDNAFVRQVNGDSVTPHAAVRLGDGTWVFYVTPFGYPRNDTTYDSHSENSGQMTCATLTGTWAWNWICTPTIHRGFNSDNVSAENIALASTAMYPVASSSYGFNVLSSPIFNGRVFA